MLLDVLGCPQRHVGSSVENLWCPAACAQPARGDPLIFFWRTPLGLAVVGGGSGAGEDRARAGRRTAYEARLSFEACGREGCLARGVECEEHGRPQDAYGAQCVDWSSELRCARALAKAGGIWLVFRIPEKSAWSKTSHSVDGVNVCV